MKSSYVFALLTIFALTLLIQNCSRDIYAEVVDNGITSTERYIVIVKDNPNFRNHQDVGKFGQSLLDNLGAEQEPKNIFYYSIKGFTACLTSAQAKKLAKVKEIAHLEKDLVISTPDIIASTEHLNSEIEILKEKRKENNLAWIFGTGIDHSRKDLNVDRTYEFTRYNKGTRPSTNDHNGQGTHIASTLGSKNKKPELSGLIPDIKLVPLKVLDDQACGSLSAIVCGIDHVAQYASPGDIAVLPFANGQYNSIDLAIQNACKNSGVKFNQASKVSSKSNWKESEMVSSNEM